MNGTYTQRRRTQMAGGGLTTLPRQNYGIGSWVKERVRKIIPKEVAKVAQVAAPFVAPFNPIAGGLMAGLGSFQQTGRMGKSLVSGLGTYGLGQAARHIGGAGMQQGWQNPLSAGSYSVPWGAQTGLGAMMSGGATTGPTNIHQGTEKAGVFKRAFDLAAAPFKKLGTMGKGTAMLTVGAIGTGLAYVADKLVGDKDPGETMEEFNKRRKSTMSEYLRYYYKNVNPLASEEEVANFVKLNTEEYRAQGGRIGYATGSARSGGLGLAADLYRSVVPSGLSEPDWYAGSSIAMPGTAWDEEYSGMGWDQLDPSTQQRILDIYDPSDEPYMTVEDWQGMIPSLGRSVGPMGPMGPVGPTLLSGAMMPPSEPTRGLGEIIMDARSTETPPAIRGGSLGSRIRPAASQAAPEGVPYVAMQNTLAQNIAANRAQQQSTQGMLAAARARLASKKGGRIGYALGSLEAGAPSITYGGLPTIPGTPRMAPDGLEYDMSQNGGFQPLGAQEGKDDVKANLAKNEFVFTADAVRGAGDGDIETGAQRMYDTMKQLENRVFTEPMGMA